MRIHLALLALMLLACTLSNVPPTPTTAPFPTTDPALQFSTPFAPDQTGLSAATPTLDISGVGSGDGSTLATNPNCPQPPGWITYVVESGDTFGLLSLQTDTPVADLAAANCVTDQDTLFVGQVIYLPTQPVVQ